MRKIFRAATLVLLCSLVLSACAGDPWRKQRLPKPRVGMTQEQVRNETSWGNPLTTNTLSTGSGRTEIWYWGVYSTTSWVMFQNGIVTAVYE